MEGRLGDLQTLLGQDYEIDRLASAILVYIDRWSQAEHTKEDGRQMVDLGQIANNLENISDILTTNLVSLGQQRVAEGIDLTRLRDESTSQFADTVTRNLKQAIGTISQPSASVAEQVIAAKRVIEEQAAAARKSFLEKLQLADKRDVPSFHLATNMINWRSASLFCQASC